MNTEIITIKQFFELPFNLCFTLGIRLYKWSGTERTTPKQLFFLCNFALHTAIYPFLIVIYQLNIEPGDILDRTTSLTIAFFCTNSITKITTVAMNYKKLRTIIHKLIKYYPNTLEEQKVFNLFNGFKDVRRVGNIMFYTHVLTAFLFDITPLIIFGVEYIHSGGEKQIDYTLPYGVWYPWDHRQPAMYAFTYAIQLLGSYVAITNFVVPDLILASVASLANLNFGYISKRIREIQPKGNKEDIKCLGELLAYHDDILHMIDEVNDVFSISILLSYFGFSGMSCLIGVNVLTGTHIIEVLKYIVSILSILLIMYYVSKIGTEMITASTDISAALTDHAWYDGNKYYQRMLPFPIARAQRPAVLKGYKFFVLSMESFQSLLTTSYQLFTLMKTRYAEEN